MPDVQARRRSQRELREGMGPRRLAERSTDQHVRELQRCMEGVRGVPIQSVRRRRSCLC